MTESLNQRPPKMYRLLGTRLRALALPFLRLYLRYFPFRRGKGLVWRHTQDWFEEASHQFCVRTVMSASMIGDTRDIIDRFIYVLGGWEFNLSDFIIRRLRPGDVFIDAGANTGYFSLLAAGLVGPTGAVVSIEASPAISRILSENLQLNRTDNVRVATVAASDRPGKSVFFESGPGNRGRSSILASDKDEQVRIEVETTTIEQLLTPDEFGRVRLVKLDVEGAELLALNGMISLLAKGPENLEVIVEIAPGRLRHFDQTPSDIINLMNSNGFNAYELRNNYSIAGNFPPRKIRRPRRLEGPIVKIVDVVFSRIDAEEL